MRLVERPAPGNKIAAKLHVKFGIVFVTSGGSVRKAQRKLFLHPPPADSSSASGGGLHDSTPTPVRVVLPYTAEERTTPTPSPVGASPS